MALRSLNNPIASFIDYLAKTGTDAATLPPGTGTTPANAQANTGGGGGGSGYPSWVPGGAGGSGIVIIRYLA